ncbi:hypothetical protein B296_00014728 [Ensete ventricosum]|uniref:Uncharacterized protein n=1 Tax=Ensete ventricosum TaxID=4639 RepID=A0A426YF96_ENSVE|nr:hypothetical protein B296_00014728 [Ensete ventricosum]
MKQPAEAAGKKLVEEHPVGIEERYAKQSAASEPNTNRSAAATVSRPIGRPSPRGEEVTDLPRLKLRLQKRLSSFYVWNRRSQKRSSSFHA